MVSTVVDDAAQVQDMSGSVFSNSGPTNKYQDLCHVQPKPNTSCVRVLALIFMVVLSVCMKTPSQIDLRARIAAAKTAQYCHSPSACFNPNILVVENGYFITIFVGDKPKHETVPADSLARDLVSLPMNVWPEGPTILITPSDDVIDGKAIERNLKEAQRICNSLGLNVDFRPGG